MGMSQSNLPFGAFPILKARQAGKRPADLILISMIGALPNELNPIVIAEQNKTYDWKWLRGLSCCFWTTPATYVAKHIINASKALPSEMYLWDYANEKGFNLFVLPTVESIDKPKQLWDWKVDALRWMPFQEKEFAQGKIKWN
jgi:hypothetical protein